jgi:trans-aconitate methyltransferase
MGGRSNAQDVIDCVHDVIGSDAWKSYFHSFSFPYYFYTPEDYEPWLREAGLECLRNELIPKEMTQNGKHGFAGWFRTTWLPYTNRIPENRKDVFVDTVVSVYIKRFPIKDDGLVRARMVRLEVEAVRA